MALKGRVSIVSVYCWSNSEVALCAGYREKKYVGSHGWKIG